MTNILETEYVEPTRPYSQNELRDMRRSLYRQLRLSNEKAYHQKCNHNYFVKQNGKKEKEMKESGNVGNCSVCWKLSKTPNSIKHKAYELISIYCREFGKEPEIITYNLFDLENVYYRWLYEELS
jgi:hypothetical protein